MRIFELKAWELREKIYKGEVSAREVVESYLNRIEISADDTNEFITIDKEGALAQADKVDKKIRNKEELGALAGLPIGVKDNIITKNIKTTCGSKMLENFIPPYDATVVEKIKNADGIILGKTSMDEFGITSDFDGAAQAVASNKLALALSSDTGGALRYSANASGVVGIKPSYGLISRYGLVTVANTLDQIGVAGRDIKDAVLTLNTVMGYDVKDSTSINKSYEFTYSDSSIKDMKVGIPKELLDLEMDTKIKDSFFKTVELLKENGAVVNEISLPHFKYAVETYQLILAAESSSNMARFDGLRYGYRAKEYGTLDELYIKSRTESFGDDVKRTIILGTYILTDKKLNDYYNKALRIRTLIKQDFENAFDNNHIILTPFGTQTGNKKDIFTVAVNLAGNCAMSVPLNMDGINSGIQIIGNKFREADIIRAGLAFERMVK